MEARVCVLAGDGVGEEVTQESMKVLEAICRKFDHNFEFIECKKEDLSKAPQRHATSKIKEFNDLYKINTMGFRGEALASIFSVSKAKIVSSKDGKAYEISSENKEVRESAGPQGTSVHVNEIFYNTPARKKYLKFLL